METPHEREIQVDGTDTGIEQGVEVPYEQLNPNTLRNVVGEFVTREWEKIGCASYTLDEKVEQDMAQLKAKKAKLVFDPATNTCNIIPAP